MAKKLAKDLVTIDRRRSNRRDERTEKEVTAKKALAKGSKKNIVVEAEDVEEIEEVAAPVSIPAMERRAKVNRRRQIDPTTCEREYRTTKSSSCKPRRLQRKNGRMFPTCSEVLEVVRSLGYTRSLRYDRRPPWPKPSPAKPPRVQSPTSPRSTPRPLWARRW